MDRLFLRIHNETVLRDLEEGDLVEFPREFFSHWGIYVGNEHVVHLVESVNVGGISSYSGDLVSLNGEKFGRGSIKMEPFWDVAKNSKARKSNHYDKKISPLPRHKIKRRALECVGPSYYNLFRRNCEHFAFWCRYGVDLSKQVDTALVCTIVAGALSVVLGLGIALVRGIGNKKD